MKLAARHSLRHLGLTLRILQPAANVNFGARSSALRFHAKALVADL
ncbi:MAG: hypothetical protein ACRD2P_03555 [Terriglobia bacterium]